MPGKSIPIPEEYIVWRDNHGKYHVAKRPPDLHAPMPSRTRAVQWLWGEYGREFANRKSSPDVPGWTPGLAPTPTVWHFDPTSEEEDNREPAKR